jgi:hypothetical protein
MSSVWSLIKRFRLPRFHREPHYSPYDCLAWQRTLRRVW